MVRIRWKHKKQTPRRLSSNPVENNFDVFYSVKNMAHLQRSIDQINSGKVVKTTLKKLEAVL